jgi:hypothetical protein
MKKVVGVMVVAAALGLAAPARAEPMGAAANSGLGACREMDRFDNLTAADDSVRSRASMLWRDERMFRFDDDDFVRGYASSLPSGWALAKFHANRESLFAGNDWNQGLHLGWFKNGHKTFDARKAAAFWAQWRGRLNKWHPQSPSGGGTDSSVTPEPASMILLGSGAVALLGVRRRKEA